MCFHLTGERDATFHQEMLSHAGAVALITSSMGPTLEAFPPTPKVQEG